MAIFGHVPGGEDFADIYEDMSAERVIYMKIGLLNE